MGAKLSFGNVLTLCDMKCHFYINPISFSLWQCRLNQAHEVTYLFAEQSSNTPSAAYNIFRDRSLTESVLTKRVLQLCHHSLKAAPLSDQLFIDDS